MMIRLAATVRAHWTQLADRAVRSAAHGAILSIGVESAQVDALAIDWRLMGGMAAGGALLSVLTSLGARGITGRTGPEQ